MSKIYVIGIGPGHPDYLLPLAKKTIESMDIIIAGKRNQENFDFKDQEVVTITGDLDRLKNTIENNMSRQTIGVIVSGDPAFYSMQRWLIENFGKEQLEIIPGISSVQYFFNQLKKSHEKSYWVSLHGRNNEFLSKIKNHRYTVLLTDHQNTPRTIAKKLIDQQLNYQMYVGENLSYADERISSGTPEMILAGNNYDMSVVVIENDRFEG